MRRLLLLDPDPDVAAEIGIALPFDLDQQVGDALEQHLLLRGVEDAADGGNRDVRHVSLQSCRVATARRLDRIAARRGSGG